MLQLRPLIINNEKFATLKPRAGTEVDERNLIQLFSYLGYVVEKHRDCSSRKIYEIMNDIKNRDHSKYDSFICCILSHGLEGLIYGSDDQKVSLDEVTTTINGDNAGA